MAATSTQLDTGVVGRIHDAFNRRDLDAIAAELTDDVVFHAVPGLEDMAPTLRGRDQVLEGFSQQLQLAEAAGGRIEHHNAQVLGGYLVAVGTAMFGRGDERFLIIDVCRVREGKLAERWAMHDDPQKARQVIAASASTSRAG